MKEFKEKFFLYAEDKIEMAKQNIDFFYITGNEYKRNGQKYLAYNFYKHAEKIKNCLNYWECNVYEKNKVMEVKKIFRCKELFCPNCRTVKVYKAIIKFTPFFNRMVLGGYKPYLMTLTVPNIELEQLSSEINKMNKAFIQLWRWLYKPFNKTGTYYGGYKDRLFSCVGAVKVLEVTVQKSNSNYFHVHFHVISFLDNANDDLFFKDIPGGYQHRTDSNIFYSMADIFLQKLWKMTYDDKKISEFGNISDDWKNNYICDIRELKMPYGIYEVFKYCFKDIDIKNIEIFKQLFFGLNRKRLRQGYGALYNLKIDDKDLSDDESSDDDIKNYLEYKDEIPVAVNSNLKDMTEKYGDYKKISIFKNNSKFK